MIKYVCYIYKVNLYIRFMNSLIYVKCWVMMIYMKIMCLFIFDNLRVLIMEVDEYLMNNMGFKIILFKLMFYM